MNSYIQLIQAELFGKMIKNIVKLNKKTFGEFKHALYSNSFEIFDVYCAFIRLRNKITIKGNK